MRISRATTSCLLAVFCSLPASAQPSSRFRPAALILMDATAPTAAVAERGILALGGRVLQALGDVLIVEIPPGAEIQAYRVSGVREVALSAVPIPKAASAGSHGRATWNAFVADAKPLPAAPLDALGQSVRVDRNGTEGLYLSWEACAGATRYRVYRRDTPVASASLVAEASKTAWNATAASTGYYQVVPVDACGGERAN